MSMLKTGSLFTQNLSEYECVLYTRRYGMLSEHNTELVTWGAGWSLSWQYQLVLWRKGEPQMHVEHTSVGMSFLFLHSNVVQDLKEVQKMRKRQQGVSADDLAATKTEKKETKQIVCDQTMSRKSWLSTQRQRSACKRLDEIDFFVFIAWDNCVAGDFSGRSFQDEDGWLHWHEENEVEVSHPCWCVLADKSSSQYYFFGISAKQKKRNTAIPFSCVRQLLVKMAVKTRKISLVQLVAAYFSDFDLSDGCEQRRRNWRPSPELVSQQKPIGETKIPICKLCATRLLHMYTRGSCRCYFPTRKCAADKVKLWFEPLVVLLTYPKFVWSRIKYVEEELAKRKGISTEDGNKHEVK